MDEWRAFLDTRVNTAEVYRKMDAAVEDDAIYRLFDHNVRMVGLEKMVLVLRGTTRRILPTLAQGQFHLAFIDASHLYSEVYADIRETMPLIAEGGILCGDDLEYQLEEVDVAACDRAVQEGRDYYSEPNSGRTYHPGVTRAVGELLGRVSAWDGFWALQRRGSEWLPISLDGYARVLPAHLIPEVRSSAGDPQMITVDGARYLVLGQQMTPCEIPCQALGVDDENLFLLSLVAMRCEDQKP